MRIAALLICQSVLFAAPAAFAHEFWIAPEKYQVEVGENIQADFVNGQEFRGGTLAWFDKRVDRAEAMISDMIFPIEGRLGDVPAITQIAPEDGLMVLITEAAPSTVNYREPEKFADFVNHKDLPVDLATMEYPFKEAYSRHAKALVAIGSGAGQDQPMGMATEFVALENPYTDDVSDGLDVHLLYQGAPRADAQIEVFQMDPEGQVTITLLRSDQDGKATIPVLAGHRYLIDSVVLRPPAQETLDRVAAPKTVKWETLWAALTFAVPQ